MNEAQFLILCMFLIPVIIILFKIKLESSEIHPDKKRLNRNLLYIQVDYGFKKEIISRIEFERRLSLGTLPIITTSYPKYVEKEIK